jgi:hypothetical protein
MTPEGDELYMRSWECPGRALSAMPVAWNGRSGCLGIRHRRRCGTRMKGLAHVFVEEG